MVQESDAVLARMGLRVDVDASLETMEHGLPLAIHHGTCLLSEFKDLGGRFEKLRPCWPCLRDVALRSYGQSQPFETASLAWTLREVLTLRKALRIALPEADATCAQIQDGIERFHASREERRRYRGLTEKILGGFEPAVGARVAATFWLRRAAAWPFSTPEPVAASKIAEVLEQNLAVVPPLACRLEECEATIKRVAPIAERQAARRFLSLKKGLAVTADEVVAVRRELLKPKAQAHQDGLARDAAVALRELHVVADRAGALLLGMERARAVAPFPEEPDEADNLFFSTNVYLTPGSAPSVSILAAGLTPEEGNDWPEQAQIQGHCDGGDTVGTTQAAAESDAVDCSFPRKA